MATALEELYERDFYAWTRNQARALRRLAATRPNEEVDWPRLIEEVADLGKTERDTVRSMAATIMEHLLKLEHSPAAEPRIGWAETIIRSRRMLARKLTKGLRHDAKRQLPGLYAEAREDAAEDLRLYREYEAAAGLPDTCPYTLDQVLGRGWFPKNRHGLPDIP